MAVDGGDLSSSALPIAGIVSGALSAIRNAAKLSFKLIRFFFESPPLVGAEER